MDSINIEKERGLKLETIEEIARANFSMWTDALLTKESSRVADLYSADATFLPTVSPEFKYGKAEAEKYFEHFLQKNPNGNIVKEKIQPLGNDIYLHSGLYDFEVGANGKKDIVKARFSFVWRKEPDGEWRIIHHHSSVKPK